MEIALGPAPTGKHAKASVQRESVSVTNLRIVQLLCSGVFPGEFLDLVPLVPLSAFSIPQLQLGFLAT